MKIIISENTAKSLIGNMLLEDGDLENKIAKEVKKEIENGDIKKDIDKRVKEIVALCIHNLFKSLWQRSNFYEDDIKR